jgi:hypothetical protein
MEHGRLDLPCHGIALVLWLFAALGVGALLTGSASRSFVSRPGAPPALVIAAKRGD